MQVYARGGFIICVIPMDMEFEKIKDDMGLVDVTIMVTREHVIETERGVHFTKEAGVW